MTPPDHKFHDLGGGRDAPAPAAAHHTTVPLPQCDQCGSPVREEQRYCLACGAHRQGVFDPAQRYFNQSAAAQARVARAQEQRARASSSPAGLRGLSGLLVALAIALIPVAAAIGVSVGRSTNNDDAALVRAALHEAAAQTTTVVATGAGATTGGSAATRAAASSSAATKASGAGTKRSKTAAAGKTATKASAASSTTAANTSTSSVANSEKVASEAQSATGSNYNKLEQNNTGAVGIP